MSQMEMHIGKLKKLYLGGKTIDQWCEEKCNSIGVKELKCTDSWKEELRDHSEIGRFFVVDNEVWEAFDHHCPDDDYLELFTKNLDGTISFVVNFYNGATCISEVIEEGVKKLKFIHKLK